MDKDKAYLIRKTFIVITLILIFATIGLLLLSFNLKSVNLNYYGDSKNVKTLASTVQSFLLQNKISISDDMIISPSLDSKLTDGMEIKIESKQTFAKLNLDDMNSNTVVAIKFVNDVEQIAFAEEKIENATLNRGITKVTNEGKEGKKATTYLVKYENEVEVSKSKLDTKVIEEPQNKIIEVGTKLNVTVSRSGTVSVPSNIQVDSEFKQYNIKLPVEQQKYAYNMCKQYGINYELFLAMMYKESGYNPNAIGGGNSYGLTQIHVSNHAKLKNKLGISNFLNPYDSIKAGAYMLSIYFGSANKIVSGFESVAAYALNSYNMGEGIFYNSCFSKGILNRGYSNSILALRNKLIANGGI